MSKGKIFGISCLYFLGIILCFYLFFVVDLFIINNNKPSVQLSGNSSYVWLADYQDNFYKFQYLPGKYCLVGSHFSMSNSGTDIETFICSGLFDYVPGLFYALFFIFIISGVVVIFLRAHEVTSVKSGKMSDFSYRYYLFKYLFFINIAVIVLILWVTFYVALMLGKFGDF